MSAQPFDIAAAHAEQKAMATLFTIEELTGALLRQGVPDALAVAHGTFEACLSFIQVHEGHQAMRRLLLNHVLRVNERLQAEAEILGLDR